LQSRGFTIRYLIKDMSLRWRRQFRILALIVLLGVVAGVPAVRGVMLRAVGRALVVDEPVESADIIVVSEWAGGAGAIDAADLVRGGIAARVAVLPAPPKPAEQELTRRGVPFVDENAHLLQLLRALGVENVELIPDPAAGTEAEGRVLLSWSGQRGFRSILVMSSPDHSRRVRRVLRRSMRGHSTKVIVRSARYSAFDPDRWWTTRDGIRTGIVELQKLSLDLIRHPIS
jgi:hypothetical protein